MPGTDGSCLTSAEVPELGFLSSYILSVNSLCGATLLQNGSGPVKSFFRSWCHISTTRAKRVGTPRATRSKEETSSPKNQIGFPLR